MSSPCVLIVDDEPDIRNALSQTLALADIAAETARDAASASEILRGASAERVGVILCDVKMPGRDGFDLLAESLALDPERPFILLTGHGDIAMAVEAMRAGAYDFLEKPSTGRRMLDVIERALEKRRLVLDNRRLRASLADEARVAGRLLGDSRVMRRFRETLARVAAADVDLLVHGETGAGKELTARAVHEASPRRGGRFVAINCGALPAELAESELFGHEPGAFTGAQKRRVGKFQYADGGTLFLDEIESMPLALQVSLLRVLQEREVEPLGSNAPQKLDLRVIAATKVDLRAAADSGRFREDLLYRLDVARLDVPPLRDRGEDVLVLFDAFAEQACARRGAATPETPGPLRDWLRAQRWPGNVRELRNAAERFAIGLPLGPGVEASDAYAVDPTEATLAQKLDLLERRLIADALEAAGGKVTEACARLGLARNTLYDKLKKHGLSRGE